MEYFLVSAVFTQAIIFQLFALNARKLQEKNFSVVSVFYFQKFAIIPAILLFMFTFDKEFIPYLLSKEVLIFFFIVLIFWPAAQFMTFVSLNATSSLSYLEAMIAFAQVPVFLLFGVLVNNDHPNSWALIALAFLSIALVIKPKQHIENTRKLFSFSATFVVLLILVKQSLSAFVGASYRSFLQNTEVVLFGISCFILLATVSLNILFLFKKISTKDKKAVKKNIWLVASIPLLWFVASVPEGVGYFGMPIYTFIVLSAVIFLMVIASDLKNKRIELTGRTVLFSLLVFSSIVFSILSLG